MPRIGFVFDTVAGPSDHSVEHDCLFVVLRARPQALRLLQLVEFLELGLEPIEVRFGAHSVDVVSVDGAAELALLVEEDTDKSAGIFAMPAIRRLAGAVHVL